MHLQLFPGLNINDKLKLFQKLTFLTSITDELIKYLTDYYESVREQAQLLLAYIVQNFLPEELHFDQD